MYQNIHLVIIDEQLAKIAEFGNFAPVLNATKELIKNDTLDETYPWLSTIEPYGDTYFNHLQAIYLIKDLEKLKTSSEGANIADLISNIIIFIDQLNVSTNLKFIGD